MEVVIFALVAVVAMFANVFIGKLSWILAAIIIEALVVIGMVVSGASRWLMILTLLTIVLLAATALLKVLH